MKHDDDQLDTHGVQPHQAFSACVCMVCFGLLLIIVVGLLIARLFGR